MCVCVWGGGGGGGVSYGATLVPNTAIFSVALQLGATEKFYKN